MYRSLAYLCAFIIISHSSSTYAETADYIRGYVSAVVHDESTQAIIKAVEVQPDGEIILDVTPCLSKEENKRIQTRLKDSKIVSNVKWKDTPECATEVVVVDDKTPHKSDGPEFLPEKELFLPVQADSHEARFSLSYLDYESNDESFNFGYITAGDTFPLLTWDYQEYGQLQLALEGGVFALFDLEEDSNDLVNADYTVGLPLMYRKDAFSVRARLSHQSSHLGDEFLINNPEIERVNFSYEEFELLGSYDWKQFRLLAGGGRIIHSEPDLDPWRTKGGLEYRYPNITGEFDLLAAGLVTSAEDQDWNISQSYKIGLAIQKSGNREVQLMLQYYNGYSPNGQFFEDKVEYFGLGLFFDT